MSVLSRLSDEEKRTIMSYIEAYGDSDNSDGGDGYYEMNASGHADIDYLLRYWDGAKSEYLGDMFGDSLIKKIPITYEQSIDDVNFGTLYDTAFYERMSYFCWQKRHKSAYGNVEPEEDYIYEYDTNGDWLNPLYHDDNYWRRSHKCENIYRLLTDEDSLFDNIYHGRSFVVKYYEDSVKITTGMKVSRALAKLSQLFKFDDSMFEEWRIKHSQLINTKLLTGNLCLSIHPMDYITMSDGAFTSCMNWMSGGGYRRGTVEMMNSEKVVVAYLESDDKKLEWYDHTNSTYRNWNYKKWRVLIIVDPKLICSVKGYPYFHAELINKAILAMQELAEPVLGAYSCVVNEFDDSDYCINPLSPEDIVAGKRANYISFSTDAMYNDFGTTTHYIVLSEEFNSNQSYDIYYSGESECMWCGQTGDHDDFPNEGAVYCYSCRSWYSDEDYCYCCNCGTRLWAEDATWIDDDAYCDRCADRYVRECDICGCSVHIDNTIPLIIRYKGIGKAKGYQPQLMNMPGHLRVCEGCECDLANYELDKENIGTGYINHIKNKFEALGAPIEAFSDHHITENWLMPNDNYVALDLEKNPNVYDAYQFNIYDIKNFEDFVDYLSEQEAFSTEDTKMSSEAIKEDISKLTVFKDPAAKGDFNFLVSFDPLTTN